MRSVIDTLDGWVPCDSPRRAMRWVPPEKAAVLRGELGADVPKRVDLRDATEQTWSPGDPLLLPPAPESCYPPDAVDLPFEPAEVDG